MEEVTWTKLEVAVTEVFTPSAAVPELACKVFYNNSLRLLKVLLT